jgi:hypothetical protein
MPEAKIKHDESELEDLAFLGREFLTWLLWRVDRGEGAFADFAVSFGSRVRLKGLAGDATEATLKGGAAAHSSAARAAVGAGRTLRDADLRVVRGDREWRFGLDAETLDLRAVKLPALLTEADDDRLLERLALIDELDGMVKGAFADFLRERTRPAWNRSILPALRDWCVEGLRVDNSA